MIMGAPCIALDIWGRFFILKTVVVHDENLDALLIKNQMQFIINGVLENLLVY